MPTPIQNVDSTKTCTALTQRLSGQFPDQASESTIPNAKCWHNTFPLVGPRPPDISIECLHNENEID